MEATPADIRWQLAMERLLHFSQPPLGRLGRRLLLRPRLPPVGLVGRHRRQLRTRRRLELAHPVAHAVQVQEQRLAPHLRLVVLRLGQLPELAERARGPVVPRRVRRQRRRELGALRGARFGDGRLQPLVLAPAPGRAVELFRRALLYLICVPPSKVC